MEKRNQVNFIERTRILRCSRESNAGKRQVQGTPRTEPRVKKGVTAEDFISCGEMQINILYPFLVLMIFVAFFLLLSCVVEN